jgi:transcriptional regulator with XRE-family HTH domain
MAAKPELAEFLRSRRARIQPESVGLDGSGYRRVPGLRREELALLAGVSVDYYIRLEQGRDLSPSNSVLDSVARALRLEDVERAHLYALVHSPAATWIDEPSAVLKPQLVRPDVLRLIGFLKAPALVVGRGTSILACNSMLRALIADFDSMAPDDRSYAFWLFSDPMARQVFEERWESYARETVGVLRRDTSRWAARPRAENPDRTLVDPERRLPRVVVDARRRDPSLRLEALQPPTRRRHHRVSRSDAANRGRSVLVSLLG